MCGHGLAPRDAELGVAGQAMSPGLRKMAARAAAAVPFAKATALVGELTGITLASKRVCRSAEADGTAAARMVEAQATIDEDGHPIRDPRSSSYLAMSAPASEFGLLMAAGRATGTPLPRGSPWPRLLRDRATPRRSIRAGPLAYFDAR
jgi:hypothetical protein